MTLSKRTRQLLVLCGLEAAWHCDPARATPVMEALEELVPDAGTRRQCEDIFAVLLDNRRLTQPSYSPCDALLTVLVPEQKTHNPPFNEAVARKM